MIIDDDPYSLLRLENSTIPAPFAKCVISGYAPLGGVLVALKLCEPFYADNAATPPWATYADHATACAVATANLDVLESDDLVPRVAELEHRLDSELKQLQARRPVS